jgi:hypothetical protein
MSKEKQKLLPCPFCGSPAEKVEGKVEDEPDWYWASCSNMDCGAWDALIYAKDWNRRVVMEKQ